MNRDKWKNEFNLADGSAVPWPCPVCGESALAAIAGTVHANEGRWSREALDHEAWEPSWIDRRFTCQLSCSCGEVVALAGRQTVEDFVIESADDFKIDYTDVSEPLFFYPSLRIIDIPIGVPSDVREQIEQSFNVFWI